MKKILIVLGFICFATSLSASWDALKTGQFTVFYEPAYKARAIRILSALEYYKSIPEGIIGNKCDNLPVVLDDYGQYVNGFANPVYYNMHLINYETEDADWLSFVAVHEYTHMAQMTMTGGLPGVLSFLFGNLASTMLFAPQWTWEAITVYNESKMSKYMGRLNDGAFDTYIKICAAADEFPSLMKATYSPLEFPYGTGQYLFGSEFWNFLSLTYGEDKLKMFYKSYSESIGSYLSPVFPWAGIDRTFDEVFGDTTMELWDKWKESEKEKAKGFVQEGERVTFHGDNANWPVIKGDKLYYVKNTVEKTGAFEGRSYNKIMEIDLKSGKTDELASTTSNYPHPFRFSGNKMYYAVREIKPGYANKSGQSYGYFTVINERNMETGEDKAVLSGDIRAFYLPYDGKIIYAIDDPYKTGSVLLEFDLELKESKLLFDSEYLVLALAGNAETMIASARIDGENVGLYTVDKAKKSFTAIVNTPYYEDHPELYGSKLFFRANYGKVYSAYCYDMETKKITRLTENGSAGTPAYYEAAGEIYFAAAHVKGFDLYKKKAEFKPYTLPNDKNDFVMPPALDEAKLKTGGYPDNLATLFPKVRMPYGYYSDTGSAAGIILDGTDAIGDFGYTVTGLYDFNLNAMQYSANLTSYVLSPAILYLASDNINYRSACRMIAGLSMPLYKSIRPGLSDIKAGIGYAFYDGSLRREINPGASISFKWPGLETGAAFRYILEDYWLGSEQRRQAKIGDFYIRQFISEGKLELKGTGIYDPDNNKNAVPKIRGYADNVRGRMGSKWSFELTKPIWKIRAGMWIPVNMYVEDLCAKAFFDAAFGSGTQFSYGLELHLETKWFNIFPADIGVRAGLTKENKFFWGPVLNLAGMAF